MWFSMYSTWSKKRKKEEENKSIYEKKRKIQRTGFDLKYKNAHFHSELKTRV